MSDKNIVHIGENSPEEVAHKLMMHVAAAEKVFLHGLNVNSSREWIIRTYCQCLMAVRTPQYPDDVVGAYKD